MAIVTTRLQGMHKIKRAMGMNVIVNDFVVQEVFGPTMILFVLY